MLILLKFDTRSIELVIQVFDEFSKSIGLTVNPAMCKAYYGNVDDHTKHEIQTLTSFIEGPLPFRYLGMPLTSKKLYVHHYMYLIDKIVARVKHLNARLLSFACRVQLTKCVIFAITKYWMECINIPSFETKAGDSSEAERENFATTYQVSK